MEVLKVVKTSVGRVRRGMSGLTQALKAVDGGLMREVDVPFAKVRIMLATVTIIEDGHDAWSSSDENARVMFGPVVFARS